MGKHDKIKQDVVGGLANANIRFDDLCGLLTELGFDVRIKGSHHIYKKSGVFEILNLQPDSNGKAKPYQVRQVKAAILQHNL